MRISDWISDVCSSDLVVALFGECAQASLQPAVIAGQDDDQQQLGMQPTGLHVNFWCRPQRCNTEQPGDRTSVVEGKSVAVRVDLGGRRYNKYQRNLSIHAICDVCTNYCMVHPS